jgi:hypothetical protein
MGLGDKFKVNTVAVRRMRGQPRAPWSGRADRCIRHLDRIDGEPEGPFGAVVASSRRCIWRSGIGMHSTPGWRRATHLHVSASYCGVSLAARVGVAWPGLLPLAANR